MKTIWKFPLQLTDVQEVKMPEGAELLAVEMQGAELCLWAVVFPQRALKERVIRICGTGHTLPTDRELSPIGTVLMASGALVWHVFEQI